MGKFVVFSFFLLSFLAAEEQHTETARLSEAFGHIICKHLQRIDVKFDITYFLKGIQDAAEGKEAPMTEKECIQAIEFIQQKNLTEQSHENLRQAEAFLFENGKKEEMILMEGGKVQYQIITPGYGTQIQPHSSPSVRYTMKKIDGSVFGPPEEESISLDETIPGLRVGLLGMKEKEQRIIYIHPDLAYGPKGALLLPPNLMLVFEIEVLKTDTKK